MRMLGIVLLITEPSLQPHNLGTLGETLQEDCEVRNCCPSQVPIPNPPLCPAFAPRVGSATLPSVITLTGSSLHLNLTTPTFPCVPSVLATVLSSQRAQALLPASQHPTGVSFINRHGPCHLCQAGLQENGVAPFHHHGCHGQPPPHIITSIPSQSPSHSFTFVLSPAQAVCRPALCPLCPVILHLEMFIFITRPREVNS